MQSFSRPRSNRPAYLDGLFQSESPTTPKDHSRVPSLSRSHRSMDSLSTLHSTSTLDSQTSDQRIRNSGCRALTPALEEPTSPINDNDDARSIRSISRSMRPSLKLRTAFSSHRRTYPQSRDRANSCSTSPSTSTAGSTPRDLRGNNGPPTKPLPPVPQLPGAKIVNKARELTSMRCYYFAARHCNGWVMGGSHGDACETCLQAGFFGSP